ncbi:MAG: bifunctional proline dehydrogenase/L-glutamate gamma-semialdehyde dehydrogenase PutA [Devosia sp.]|uniref:bifunctional proline dehydrogenase/L-glutamate gamma-semialdehyde dehydrogenase PutA n=1 Tax=Devosia sp. TaxID=1871048 RepID=UPI0024CB341C|nr:bifunctional proline dehydrogenase/L-glutamate gamma-semialdehyde dehydrogenase PutA [Devosia sp.]UYO01214.1 MAG: bifunctional proline dehydrogenase/L-glutamate gamma-semialdehyde dehydrogenase PutA [Devosia sp.]
MVLEASRRQMRAMIDADEPSLVRALADQTGLSRGERKAITASASAMVEAVRAAGSAGLMEDLLAAYGLDKAEGRALMTLAEAMLRVPDPRTGEALIQDRLSAADWTSSDTGSLFTRLSDGSLHLAAAALGEPGDARNAISALAAPVVRFAAEQGIGQVAGQFVFGRTIAEAVSAGQKQRAHGDRFSYDMLGEAARTQTDAERYARAYADAIAALTPHCTGPAVRDNPGISVKLSALHPRYEESQRDRVLAELVPLLLELARAAARANMGFNIDAEEADRLELSLDVIEAVLASPDLAGWDGFGVVVQAYGKRIMPLIDWLESLSARLDRTIMVRLVKGAYWDSEIKRAQVLGLDDYPVFTQKAATDVSYLAAVRRLLACPRFYPQFATHNAHSAVAVHELAKRAGRGVTEYEFQRLHGMGQQLHALMRKQWGTQTRIYAPVGAHRDLLAYLVRRLLENGANGSFVHQIADRRIPAADVARDPVETALQLAEALPRPADIFPGRRNSAGVDLADRGALAELDGERLIFRHSQWSACPLVGGEHGVGQSSDVINPADPGDVVGRVVAADAASVAKAVGIAATSRWTAVAPAVRAEILNKAADAFEAQRGELLALLAREAGKTLPDGIAEMREAVDFLRYYAQEGANLQSPARGPFTCIAPWNFPLAIFTGQVAAALMAGNPVLAKPAPQTPLIAFRAVQLLHAAGVPADALQLLPGGGEVGAALVSAPGVAGVAFTGSTATARAINAAMASHLDPRAPLIAETGGINAMIVDSTALPEQVVRDVVASAFQSAGQRCSALRVLYLQAEVAPAIIEMLKGAMDQLRLGDPWSFATDIGPIIDGPARERIADYVARRSGAIIHQLPVPDGGHFTGPTLFGVSGIEDVPEEVFGPILHVATYRAAELDRVVAAINATGYGLTFGLHTRIESRAERLADAARAGNIYVNRNQIGAVVGSQPFGGEGLSGTGPKAGGPNYLPRFTAGGVAQRVDERVLPGVTGESNVLRLEPRGTLLCLGPSAAGRAAQHAMARDAGCKAVDGNFEAADLAEGQGFDAVALFGGEAALRRARVAMARRAGPILPLITGADQIDRLWIERHVCVDTTAAGGNTSLLNGQVN